ncbi:Micrococcal nuclease (thermonuclease)-like protein [Rubrobacter radiotolerans]|uniref:Micrococcal nuclease (Thermonuclease)-like protein n=1 Tax=Rubrobacter radiotolerans TaxID=42256 RepID=A0A023X543_RUBRA|nr:thermonuclease family protein [Rubrobacter radiotolerans]AHY47100.1 Micrococcal nuclease (thermonuclease)-like protein [Rubrobacter radiotolerans]MDX5894505.1 thermonuclease family protein [Rubrobacter radiotolerans]SMC06144.1 micrococcal nuclease [Rubrobacter radiotolerans DSM 5868]
MNSFAKLARQVMFVALLAAFLGLAAGCAAVGAVLDDLIGEETTAASPADSEVTVVRVVDGDTVEVSPRVEGIGDVRLIGVDTPEPYASGTPEPLAAEASDFARENLEGRDVTLEFDEESVDSYGRLLAYVYAGKEMFNETLLREGYAQVATFPPNTRYVERFEAAQDEAREAERGIWTLPENEACRLRDRGNGIGGGC